MALPPERRELNVPTQLPKVIVSFRENVTIWRPFFIYYLHDNSQYTFFFSVLHLKIIISEMAT